MKTEVIKSLIKAQTEMGAALKKSTNPHFKKSYADLLSVQAACLEPLHKNGFAVFQPCGQDEVGSFVDTIFIHESGEELKSRVYLIVNKNDMQGVGSAITYARRYGLMGLAGIAPEDDDGNAAAKAPAPIIDKVIMDSIADINDVAKLESLWNGNPSLQTIPAFQKAVLARKKLLTPNPKQEPVANLNGDEIPY